MLTQEPKIYSALTYKQKLADNLLNKDQSMHERPTLM